MNKKQTMLENVCANGISTGIPGPFGAQGLSGAVGATGAPGPQGKFSLIMGNISLIITFV